LLTVPLGIPHSTQQDAPLCGFVIPCETVVICNHQAVHLNDTYWNNPCEFDPDRFLDDDCEIPRLASCINNFIPFGIGKRYVARRAYVSISSCLRLLLLKN
jgi:trans-cinnamate 4-monooxygenase